MTDIEPFPFFAELQRRMMALAERLQISTDQSASQIWEQIGMVLAHKEKEFDGFEFLWGEAPKKSRGRPNTRINPDLVFATKVADHKRKHPNLRSDLKALEDMRNKGVISAMTTLASYQTRLSAGKRAIRKIKEQVEAADRPARRG